MFKKAITLAATMAFAMTAAAGALQPSHQKWQHNHVAVYAHIHVYPDCTLKSERRASDFKFSDLAATADRTFFVSSPSVELKYVCSADTNPVLTLVDPNGDYFSGNLPNNFFLAKGGNHVGGPWIPFTIKDSVNNVDAINSKHRHNGAPLGSISTLSSGTITLTAKLSSQPDIHAPYAPGYYTDIVTATLLF
jgi:hypothetical protein